MTAAPLIVLEPDSPTPPYEQVRSQIGLQIASGVLPSGTRLPSVRQLAHDLGIAPNTVVRAYGELERAGLVTTSFRRFVIVAGGLPRLTPEERDCELERAVEQVLLTARQLGANVDELRMVIDRQLAG